MPRSLVPRIASHLELSPIDVEWSGVDAVLPLIERIQTEGAVFFIKWDGERSPNRAGITILVTGGNLEDEPIRADSRCLEEALAHVLIEYATRVWDWCPRDE